MVRTILSPAMAALILFSFVMVGAPAQAEGAGADWPTGSVWSYRYEEYFHTVDTELFINGNLSVSCLDAVNISWNDETVQAVHYHMFMIAHVTGMTQVMEWTGYWVTVDVHGTYRVDISEYHDAVSGNPLMTVANESLTTAYSVYTTYYEEHNVTYYESYVIDPPSFDIDESWDDIQPGFSWSVESSTHSEVSGLVGSSSFEEEWDLEERTEFMFLDRETVSVPAGTYECAMINYSSEDTTITEWYCPDIEGDVKLESTYEDGEVSWKLTSYEPGEDDEEAVVDGWIDAWLVLGIVLPVAVGVAVAVLFLWMRTKGADEGPPPQGGGEVG